MPMIKPVSELRNYPDILKEVKVGSPVYLTKNGTGRYVLIDIADYSNVEAAAKLSFELMRGRLSGENNGWISKEQMRSRFVEKVNA